MVALLVGRTSVLKYTKEQKIQAHDDGVRMLANVTEYLESLVPPEPAPAPADGRRSTVASGSPADTQPCDCHQSSSGAALWTAPLL